MRYFKFTGDAGLAGTDFEQFFAFEDDVSYQYLDEAAYDIAMSNAEMYGTVLVEGEYDEEVDDDNIILECDLSCEWAEIEEAEYKEEMGL